MINKEMIFYIFIGCLFILRFSHHCKVCAEGNTYFDLDSLFLTYVVNVICCAISAGITTALIGSIFYFIFM